MNNIYGGMLDGQRLYEEDQRRQKQWELEQGIRAIDLDFNQQALPFKVEALSLTNDGTRLNNDLARQINPYKVDYQQIVNESGRIGNDLSRFNYETTREDRPITRQALIFDTNAKWLNNRGKEISNAEAAVSAPFNIQKKMQDNERDWFNNQKLAINLSNDQFMMPYDRGKVVMDYNDAVMKHNTNLATYPDQRRAAEADAKAKARESTQSYDIQGVNNAFRRAFVTKNYSELGQQLSDFLDDDVIIQPLQDGTIAVSSQGQQAKFSSLDDLYRRVLMKQEEEKKQEVWAVDPTNGYRINQVTGDMVKYATEPKPQELPMTNTTIGGLAGQYVGTLGLNMGAADKAMLQSDIQAGAVGLMRQGYSPSAAIQQAYEQLKPALAEGEPGWFGGKTYTYKGGALDMSKAPTPTTTATPAPTPASGALDMSKAPTTTPAPSGALDMGKAPAGREDINVTKAREAIAKGADRNKVIEMLKAQGIDYRGL